MSQKNEIVSSDSVNLPIESISPIEKKNYSFSENNFFRVEKTIYLEKKYLCWRIICIQRKFSFNFREKLKILKFKC